MRRTPLLHLVQISAAALLAGCNLLNLDPSEKTKPATEETVKGTWRNAEPDAEGKTVRMTLRIDADHKMVWSRRISGIREDGSDAEYQRENFSWTVEDGKLKAEKTACEYAYPPAYELKSEDCHAPSITDIPITVNGNGWKVQEGSRLMLFRKD